MTDPTKQPKRKRRWLRFSLRTFLIALTIFCIWIGWYLNRVEQQREAVKRVQDNGGFVRYDYEYDNQKLIANSQPSVPKWLLDMLGVDYFSTVSAVDLKSTQVSDLTPLAGLTNLEYLTLSYTQVSNVTPLAGLTKLVRLMLNDTQVRPGRRSKTAPPVCPSRCAGRVECAGFSMDSQKHPPACFRVTPLR